MPLGLFHQLSRIQDGQCHGGISLTASRRRRATTTSPGGGVGPPLIALNQWFHDTNHSEFWDQMKM